MSAPTAALTVEQLWQPVPGGSGTYIVELSTALHQIGVPVVGVAARHAAPPRDDWQLTIPVVHHSLPRRALYESWQRLGRPRPEGIAPDAEVVHATTWALPPTRLPLVVTIHDIAFLNEPDHFTRHGSAFFRRALEEARRRAAAVIVPSRSTADDLLALGVPAERITVVPHGSHPEVVDAATVRRWRERHGVARPYVLWCGTVEPRKNVGTLLDAYARLAPSHDLDLVLVGPRGWGAVPDVPPPPLRDRIHVLGHLQRHELAAAYAGAQAFCFPSVREGFGLPVLEAMSYGIPVVTSRGTACAEVAGEAGVLVDATDADAVAAGLRRALGPERDDLAAAGRSRAAGFSWNAAASATADVYAAVV